MNHSQLNTSDKTLSFILRDILGNVGKLFDCLEEEHHALQMQSIDALNSLILRKNDITMKLEALNRQRIELAGIHPATGDNDSQSNGQHLSEMDVILKAQDASGALSVQWAAIQSRLHECREANLRNGQLLQRMGQNTTQVLNTLFPQEESSSATYGCSGTAPATISPRNISEA